LRYVLTLARKGRVFMRRQDILISAAIITVALGSILVLTQRKGRVIFSTPGARLHLRGLLFGRTLNSSPQPIRVRAGTYTLSWLAMTTGGQTWQMTSQGSWGRIKVEPGTVTDLDKWGPPFKIVPQVSVHRGIANVDFQILGRRGESYSKIITKNGKSAPAPRVEILDEQGKVLASGQFAYG
jgi:hypothetical protein